MFDGLMRRVGIVADRRADPGEFIGGDRHTRAAAADDDAPVRLTFVQRPSRPFRRIRIVHRRRRMGAEVEDLVTLLGELGGQFLFQLVSSVIGAESDSHEGYRVQRVGRNQPPDVQWL